MPHTKQNKLGAFIGGSISVLLILIAILIFVFQQAITDRFNAWVYQPTAAVQTITDRLALTNKGKLYLFAAHPEVQQSADFNSSCPRLEPKNPILGCYTNDRIYIYDVTNSELDGIEEVTAAHEMLHVAWNRLSASQRQTLEGLLSVAYKSIDDTSLKERFAYYERNEPGQFYNELHSILGTEVASLGDELETYYGQYFTDRSSVVGLFQQYNAVFTNLLQESQALLEEIKALTNAINAQSKTYEQEVTALSRDIVSFNQRANNGDFTSLSQFYQERNALTGRTAALELKLLHINADIERYNQLVARYNNLAVQLESLQNSLDSVQNLEPVPSV